MNWLDALTELKTFQYGLIKKEYESDDGSYYVSECSSVESLNWNTSVTIDIQAIKDDEDVCIIGGPEQ